MNPARPTEAGQAQAILADLALAARRGPVGPATVLAAAAALSRHLVHLAEYEDYADAQAAEEMDLQRTRHEAILAGTVRLFSPHPRRTTNGGSAA